MLNTPPPQSPMGGDTEFDRILASIVGALSGYLATRNPATPQAPLPPEPTTAATNWVMLGVLGVVLYLVLK